MIRFDQWCRKRRRVRLGDFYALPAGTEATIAHASEIALTLAEDCLVRA